MDFHYELNGTAFVWNMKKAAGNPGKHDGITFEQAATVFFDPFFRMVEVASTSVSAEPRDAIVGFDSTGRLLFVVHIEVADAFIRIISARRATNDERRNHECS